MLIDNFTSIWLHCETVVKLYIQISFSLEFPVVITENSYLTSTNYAIFQITYKIIFVIEVGITGGRDKHRINQSFSSQSEWSYFTMSFPSNLDQRGSTYYISIVCLQNKSLTNENNKNRERVRSLKYTACNVICYRSFLQKIVRPK